MPQNQFPPVQTVQQIRGIGGMQYITVSGSLGAELALPSTATGVRFYLKTNDSVTFTIQNAQPTSPPGVNTAGPNPLTMANSNYDTTGMQFGTGALPNTNYGTSLGTSLLAALSANTYTLEGWIKKSGASNVQAIMGAANTTSPFEGTYIAMNASGYLYAGVWNGTTTIQITGTVSKADGNWHHVALVANGSSGAVLYVDGAVYASTATAVVAGNITAVFGVGPYGFQNVSTYNWTGELDEVAVWNNAKYTAPFTPPTAPYASGLANNVALYHFDGNGLDYSIAVVPGPPAITITGSVTGPNWDESVAQGQNIYVTAYSGTPAYRGY